MKWLIAIGTLALTAAAASLFVTYIPTESSVLPREVRPFDESADAGRDVALATARAKANGKLLLLEFGGNWCPYCRALGGLMQSPEVKDVIARHYELVWIDVGRAEKNLDLFERYGLSLEAVPSTLVIDPTTDKVRNLDEIVADDEGNASSAKVQAAWLLRMAKRPELKSGIGNHS